jgi:H-type small acid-soluble spore protein
MAMKAKRAEEILKSQEKIAVSYRNNRVWIESVNKHHNKAYVTYLDQKNTVEVEIDHLVEEGPLD